MRVILEVLPLGAFMWFAVKSTLIDIRDHRLPNELTIKATIVLFSIFLIESLWAGNWGTWSRTLMAILQTLAVYLALFMLSRGSLGFGDVKFSIPCAAVVGWYCPEFWAAAIWFSFGSAAVTALTLRVKNGLTPGHALAFGPFMFLGTIMTICPTLIGG